MGGGTLNLASTKGTGDDILSLNPQITFFKKVYKRHTNFGLESKQINASSISTTSTESSLDFGSNLNYKIPKTGTLIHDMHIEFTLPPAIHTSGIVQNDPAANIIGEPKANEVGAVSGWRGYCHWVNAVGYAIINSIELKIKNNLIDKHNGLWLDIWNELTDPYKKEWQLTGKRDDDNNEFVQQLKSRYYIPLKFYFNRNPGLALPIFLLSENDIQIDINLSSLNSLLNYGIIQGGDAALLVGSENPPAVDRFSFNTNCKITNFKFYTTYVFLDSDEENRIKTNLPNEYLIEIVNINESINPANNITLNNPVKELIWVIRKTTRLEVPGTNGTINGRTPNTNSVISVRGNNDNPNDIFNYSLQDENQILGYGSFDTFNTLQINISNENRIDVTDATHFRTIQPYKYHSNVPGGNGNEKRKYIYVYSFALHPEEYQPSGSFNFSKDDDTLKLTFTEIGNITDTVANNNNTTDYQIDLFAYHYKYLSISNNNITIKDVPYSTTNTNMSDNIDYKGIDPNIAKAIVKKKCRERTDEIIVAEEKRIIAIEEEVRRRYAQNKPDVHRHINFQKKKWSGLQGDHTNDKNKYL